MLYDALMAYILLDVNWRWLQFAGGIPTVVLISYYWCTFWLGVLMPRVHRRLMPESPRWLISQNRIEEAKSELKRAARLNKMQLDDSVWQQELVSFQCLLSLPTAYQQSPPEKVESASIIDLFRHPRLARNTLIVFYCWYMLRTRYKTRYSQVCHLNVLLRPGTEHRWLARCTVYLLHGISAGRTAMYENCLASL